MRKNIIFSKGITFGICLVALTRAVQGGVTLSTLHSFIGSDAANPAGGLVQDGDGSLYGITTDNNSTTQYGTVFKLARDGTFTNLYYFTGGVDGAWPQLGLVQGADGNLYGSTAYRGANSWGTIFSITSSGEFTTLSPMDASSGSPSSLPILGTDGNLYVTGNYGFSGALGTIFNVGPSGNIDELAWFYGTNGFTGWSFNRDLLLQAVDGNFYGATDFGGPAYAGEYQNPAYGTVFRWSSDGTLLTLFLFDGTNGANPSALLQGRDGNLYGVANTGGPAFVYNSFGGRGGYGTIFKLSTNGLLSTLAIFDGTNGSGPSSLIQASDGNFYGTTFGGGAYSRGTIFKLIPDGTLTSLFSFNATNGSNPNYSTLLEAADGSFYGTTYTGGASNLGTIFKLTITPSLPAPQLTISSANANIILTWPTNATGFTLQSAPNLTAAFTNIPGATSPFTNRLTAPQQFFRLVQ